MTAKETPDRVARLRALVAELADDAAATAARWHEYPEGIGPRLRERLAKPAIRKTDAAA